MLTENTHGSEVRSGDELPGVLQPPSVDEIIVSDQRGDIAGKLTEVSAPAGGTVPRWKIASRELDGIDAYLRTIPVLPPMRVYGWNYH